VAAQEAQWKALTDYGWRATRLGDQAGAAEYLTKALGHAAGFPEADPRRALTLSYLAVVARRQGKADDAGRYADQAWRSSTGSRPTGPTLGWPTG
jgi:Tfp pilus assembly protein PilF